MTKDLVVDQDALREQVRVKYREVAADPTASFHFHTGRGLASRLGYEAAAVDALPDGGRGVLRRGGQSVLAAPTGAQ